MDTPPPALGPPPLRAWLPHLVMLSLIVAATWLVLMVFAPLARPMLVAAALAALTHTVLMAPTLRRLIRWFPKWDPVWRRRTAAGIATAALLTAAVTPALLIIFDALGGISKTWEVALGLAARDETQITAVADVLAEHIERMRKLYPAFPIAPETVRNTVLEMLLNSNATAFYGWLFRGTGGVLAHIFLVILLVFILYERGDAIASRLLRLAPFTSVQRDELALRFQHATLRLLHDTIAMAVIRGAALGVIAWLIGDFPIVVVAAIAAFVGLVPVVGFATVWIPLTGILWSRGEPMHAIGLVVASLAAGWLIDRLGQRMIRNLDTQESWPGFLLFLGIIGGVLAFGWTGLVIGPMAVVVLKVLLGFWLPLYGVGEVEADEGPPTAANPVP